MFEVLTEVVGPEEFLALVAFLELMELRKVIAACDEVGTRSIRELLPAVTAHVVGCILLLLLLLLLLWQRRRWLLLLLVCIASVRRHCGAWVKGFLVALERCARPRMPTQMERVFVAFHLVLVFETILTILAGILLLILMLSRESDQSSN